GLTFGSGDLVEYNPIADTAALFFDANLFDGSENIDAIHVLGNGNIILSTEGGATLGGLSFADGDLVEYNPTTDIATLYFNEGLFTNNADVDAVHAPTLPEPATVALLGLGFLVLINNRKGVHRQVRRYAVSAACRRHADTHVNHTEAAYNHRIQQYEHYRYPEQR
ncbi:MAG: PEP-CTERM sorting domain-containing protein, partial [Planctomycetota bacterium]